MTKRVLIALFLCASLFAQEAPLLEYAVKGAFLYNFTKFVDWPRSAFSRNDAPLKICIFGHDSFGSSLDKTIAGEALDGHPRVVERPQTIEQLRTCHVAFIGRSEQPRFKAVLSAIGDAPVLTVGESPDFLESGGIVNFAVDRNRVRFAFNLDRARQSSLKISSKLLRLSFESGKD